MSRLSNPMIALLGGAALIVLGALYVVFNSGPSSDRSQVPGSNLSDNTDGQGTTALPESFLSAPAHPEIDLSLTPAPVSGAGALSASGVAEPRSGVSRDLDLPGSSVRMDLSPQQFSDDEVVIKPYVGVGVDVEGAGEDGSFLENNGLAADLKGKAEAGSKVEITESLEMNLGYEVQETLGSTGGAGSTLNTDREERVQGGLSLKF
ncbi:MAG: hypothetical protein P1U50_02575 [Parvibaculaceae bacterium]|nr:hypothetical protein [Parvibaculaceae bacterium]